MSSSSVSTVNVSIRVLMSLESVCKDYAHDLLKSVSVARGVSVESLLEGVDFPRMDCVDKVVKEKKDKVVKDKVVKEKVIKKSVDLPKFVLPFLGVLDGCCKGVIRNHNLYTQCVGLPKSGDLCNKCVKSQESGKFLGLITDRKVGDIEFKGVTKVVKISPYVDVFRKLNLVKEDVVADALRFGWLLSDDYFEEKEKSRGRPKKEKNVEDVEKKEKGRGRPKKDKKVVTDAGDDLIAKLVCEVNNDKSSSSSVENDDEAVPVDVVKVVAVSVAPKKAEKKKAKKVKTPSPVRVASPVEESESAESPAKVVTVKKFDFGGKKYKLSSENILYDWETDEPVGIWNAEKKCIEEYDNSSEEESDEE
jgi:hypothetical protein